MEFFCVSLFFLLRLSNLFVWPPTFELDPITGGENI